MSCAVRHFKNAQMPRPHCDVMSGVKRVRDVDSGWAWIALIVSAIDVLLIAAFVTSVGIFQVELLHSFPGSQALIAFVGSVAISGTFLLGPAAGIISDLLTYRVTIMTGGVLLCVGMVSASFTRDVGTLLFFYGFVCGTGSGLNYTSAITVVSTYFCKYRTVANGVILAAPGVGILVMPYLLRWLIDDYGWRYAMAIFGCIFAQICVLGSLLYPHNPNLTPTCCPSHWKPVHRNDPDQKAERPPDKACDKKPSHDEPVSVKALRDDVLNVKPLHDESLNVKPLHDDPLNVKLLHDEPLNVKPLHGKPLSVKPLCDDVLNMKPLHDEPLNVKPPHNKTSEVKTQNTVYTDAKTKTPCRDASHVKPLHQDGANPKAKPLHTDDLGLKTENPSLGAGNPDSNRKLPQTTNSVNQKKPLHKDDSVMEKASPSPNDALEVEMKTTCRDDPSNKHKLQHREDPGDRIKPQNDPGFKQQPGKDDQSIHMIDLDFVLSARTSENDDLKWQKAPHQTHTEVIANPKKNSQASETDDLKILNDFHGTDETAVGSSMNTGMLENDNLKVPENPTSTDCEKLTETFLSASESDYQRKQPDPGQTSRDVVTMSTTYLLVTEVHDLRRERGTLRMGSEVLAGSRTTVAQSEMGSMMLGQSKAWSVQELRFNNIRQRLQQLLCWNFMWVISLNQTLLFASYSISLILFPAYAQSVGVLFQDLPPIYTMYSSGMILSRLACGFIFNRFPEHILKMFFCFQLCCGLVLTLFPVLGVSFPALMACMCIYGLTYGPSYMLLTPIMVHYVGLRDLPVAYGIVMLCCGISSLSSPPIAGMIYDLTGDYGLCYFYSGPVFSLSALSLLLLLFIKDLRPREDPGDNVESLFSANQKESDSSPLERIPQEQNGVASLSQSQRV